MILPLNMEEDFLGLRVLVLPHEIHRSVFRKRGRRVTVKADPSIILASPLTELLFKTPIDHVLVLFDLIGSGASASPQVLLFPAVVLLAVFSPPLSIFNYLCQRVCVRP